MFANRRILSSDASPFRLGNILYIALLLINAVAVLNEERFLSRSQSFYPLPPLSLLQSQTLTRPVSLRSLVGWSHSAVQQAQFQQYADPGFGGGLQEGPGVKARLVNLIGAVRTVMRSRSLSQRS